MLLSACFEETPPNSCPPRVSGTGHGATKTPTLPAYAERLDFALVCFCLFTLALYLPKCLAAHKIFTSFGFVAFRVKMRIGPFIGHFQVAGIRVILTVLAQDTRNIAGIMVIEDP